MTTNSPGGAVVLFLDDEGWRCFDQLAAFLRRFDARRVRLVLRRPRSRLRRLTDRLLYDEVVALREPGGLDRLRDLVATGTVVDAQLSERTLVSLGLRSEAAALLSRAALGCPAAGLDVVDKFVVGGWLRAAGACVPDQLAADQATDAAAIDQLGLPLMIKRRVGTGGVEVRMATTTTEVERAVADLGGDRPAMFFERHVDGDCIHYGGVFHAGGPAQEFAGVAWRSETAPLGPSTALTTIDEPDLVAEGRRLIGLLGATGFVALGFMRDDQGRCWHIDTNTRVWGNVLSVLGGRLNLFEGYSHVLGLRPDPPRLRTLRVGVRHPVQPAALKRQVESGRPSTFVSIGIPFVRHYLPALGARYGSLVVLELANTLRLRLRNLVRGSAARGAASSEAVGGDAVRRAPTSRPPTANRRSWP